MFDFSEREVEELRSIGKDDVLTWYVKYLKQSSPDCRRLTIQVWGCNAEFKEAKEEKKQRLPRKAVQTYIDDLIAFKTLSSYYPSFC